jgi:threonine dehydrogenase-like Zn-dependent dehydrogenase
MRAAVITAPGQCELATVDTPHVGEDQVLIRVEGCGVCGSNLPVWEGRPWFTYPTPPGSPGHEGWGRIVARGPAARVAVGQRVAFLSERAFAEYDLAHVSSIVQLPPALDGIDVPGEPLGCATNIVRRAVISAGHVVAVVGIGFLGALVTQLATRVGASVIAISQRAYSLKLAKQMGAVEALALDGGDDTIVKRVEQLSSGRLCDRVIELVGLQRPLDLAAKLCRVRGRLVIGGFHQDGPRQVDMFLWNWRGLDVINAHERDSDAYVSGITTAIDRVASGVMVPEPLYTHRVDLARAGEAFELLRRRPPGFVKALVKV